MSPISELVCGVIRATAPEGGKVNMTVLRRNLRDVCLEYEDCKEIVEALDDDLWLILWPTGQIEIPKTRWRCDQCGLVVNVPLEKHIDPCLKLQRIFKKISEDEA